MNAYVTVNVVPDDIREIPFLIGHPFTERPRVTIMSAPNGLRVVEEVVPVANRTDKTATWAEGTLVFLKNRVGHDAA